MAKVTIRYWAAARDAAGVTEEEVTADTLAEALDTVAVRRAPDARLGDVLARSSFLVDGDPAKRPDHPVIRLNDGAVVEILPPFAGG
jgi:molybdopterin converting factor small subunit